MPLCLLVSSFSTGWAKDVTASAQSRSAVSIPTIFEANQGQTEIDYRFVARHVDGDVRFTDSGPDFLLHGQSDQSLIQLRPLTISGSMRVEGKQPLQARSNYLVGRDASRWITNVSTFAQVSYDEIYPGVELLFYGNKYNLEHDFVVSPHANPAAIRFTLKGSEHLELNGSGDLIVRASGQSMILRRPVAYQEIHGQRVDVASAFHLEEARPGSDAVVSFRVGDYDSSKQLIIDPVLTFSTYLGGTHADIPTAIATDSSGNIYVAGNTRSPDYPLANPYRSACGACSDSVWDSDAYISKLDPTGHTLLYSTYFGGNGQDEIDALAIDSTGNIVAAGYTNSSDFPSVGSFVSSVSSGVFAVSLDATGSVLKFSEIAGDANVPYIGNWGYDAYITHAFSLALDSSNNVYVVGLLTANNGRAPKFPIDSGTYGYGATNFGQGLFALKLGSDGRQIYGTVIPPISPSAGYPTGLGGIAIDPQGNLYISGTTQAGFPSTAGALATTFPNPASTSSGFLLSLNSTATALNFSTYLPGTDMAGPVVRASDGSLYVSGQTSRANLPVSDNAFQKTLSAGCNCNNGYILHIDATGSTAVGGTYFSGTLPANNVRTGFGTIALDAAGNVFVGGNTSSDDFPVVNPIASFSDETGNLLAIGSVIAGLTPDLSSMVFGSYFNGEGAGSHLTAMTVTPANRVVVAGITYSNSNFITTPNAYQPNAPASPSPYTGYLHQYVASIDLTVPAPSVCFDKRTVSFTRVAANTSTTANVKITNCGNATLTIYSIVPSSNLVTVSQPCWTIAAGDTCTLQLSFTPASFAFTTGTVTIQANSVIAKHTLVFNGQGIASSLSTSPNVAFAPLLVGSTTPIQGTLFVQNMGNAPLTFLGVSVTGDFSIAVNSCTSPLPAAPSNQICVIGLRYLPTAIGNRTGSLVINSNDPVSPQTIIPLTGTGLAAYTVPVVTSLSKPSQVISTAATDIYVYGSNFFPQSIVRVLGQPVPTTYVSGTSLRANLAPSLLSSIGDLAVTVYNPTPGGGESLPQTLNVYNSLSLTPSFMVSVPSTGTLYASIPNSTIVSPNTVVPIDAATGVTGAPIPVGRNPVMLAASSDGRYLYVALRGDQAIQRINLQTNAIERTFPFPANICTTCGASTPTDLQVVPGDSKQVVLSLGNMLALYNDAGLVNSVPESYVYTFAPTFNSIAFAGPSQNIYSLPFTIVQNSYFGSVTLDAAGLHYTRVTGSNFGGTNTTGAQVVSDGTLLYTSAGQVWDPASASQVGTFPVSTYNSTTYPNSWNLVVDPGVGRLFVAGFQAYGSSSSADVLTIFDQRSLTAISSLAFPDMQSVSLSNLVRWGSNGVAFMGSGNVYIVKSGVVSSVASNPSPILSSISPETATVGGDDFTLTLNGSSFIAGSVVNWNGARLATTYVNSTRLTATVPASNLVSTGTAQISVSNPAPGGGTSTVLQVTVTALSAPAISFSIANHTFGDPPFQISAASNSSGAISYSVVSGPATLSGSTLMLTGSGVVTVQASQAAAGSYAASTQNASFISSKAITTLSISSSANPFLLQNAITLTATIAASATGTIAFTEGSTALGTGAVTNGAATFTSSTLTAGSHTITATYSGDTSFLPVSKTFTQVIQAFTFSVPSNGSPTQTVQRGGSVAYNLLLNSSGSPLPAAVTLAVTGLPAGATATFSPAAIAAGAGSTPVTLTVQIPANLAALSKEWAGQTSSFNVAVLLLPFVRRRSVAGRLAILLCLGAAVSTLVACAGSPSSSSSQSQSTPKTYTLTVTGTAGAYVQSTTVTMIVQ